MTEACDFCLELQPANASKRIAWLDDKWALMATYGPLSESHILLVPRDHQLFSLANDADLLRVDDLLRNWSNSLQRSAWVAFEHANAQVGCGVTHAHVHLVALGSSVGRDVLFAGTDHSELTSLAEICGDKRELLWCAGDAFGPTVTVQSDIPSQLARRRIAEATGLEIPWDWRAYTHAPWFAANVKLAYQLAGAWRARQT
jgi:diadenosine tetraphosphate (Ap4A) HIT family hydrolase